VPRVWGYTGVVCRGRDFGGQAAAGAWWRRKLAGRPGLAAFGRAALGEGRNCGLCGLRHELDTILGTSITTGYLPLGAFRGWWLPIFRFSKGKRIKFLSSVASRAFLRSVSDDCGEHEGSSGIGEYEGSGD